MTTRGGLAAIVAIGLVLALATVERADARSTSEIVGVRDLANGAGEVWVFLPEAAPTCEVVYLHDSGDLTPERYTPWLSYLAITQHCAAIFPRFQLTAGTHPAASDLRGLRSGISTGLAYVHASVFKGHTSVSTNVPVLTVGFGYGAVLALAYAGHASSWGLPVPRAVDSIFPVDSFEPGLLSPRIPASTHVLIQVGDRDRAGGKAGGQVLWRYLTSHPASRKHLQVVHSTAALPAVHSAPLRLTNDAEVTFWEPLDMLIANTQP